MSQHGIQQYEYHINFTVLFWSSGCWTVARCWNYVCWYTFYSLHICYTSWSDSFSHILLPKTFVLLSFVTYWVALHGEGREGRRRGVCLASQAGRVKLQTARGRPGCWKVLVRVSNFCLVAYARRVFCPIFHICQRNYRGSMREIVHLQAGQCGNQIGAKVSLGPV
jgi:hypothetical protein